MKPLVSTALAVIGCMLAPASLHSHLFIDAGKEFLLGGGQRGVFAVRAHNVGAVAVEVREELPGHPATLRGTLAPGGRTRLRFAAGATARLRNLGSRQAELQLDVTGDTGQLRMTYEPTER